MEISFAVRFQFRIVFFARKIVSNGDAGRTFDSDCTCDTEIDIEVWDWDMFRLDDKIGLVRVKLGALESGSSIDLNPAANGRIFVRCANFIECCHTKGNSLLQQTAAHGPSYKSDMYIQGTGAAGPCPGTKVTRRATIRHDPANR
jgi:hypothetical protein